MVRPPRIVLAEIARVVGDAANAGDEAEAVGRRPLRVADRLEVADPAVVARIRPRGGALGDDAKKRSQKPRTAAWPSKRPTGLTLTALGFG